MGWGAKGAVAPPKFWATQIFWAKKVFKLKMFSSFVFEYIYIFYFYLKVGTLYCTALH